MEGESSHLGVLLTMVINHFLTGMFLQVPYPNHTFLSHPNDDPYEFNGLIVGALALTADCYHGLHGKACDLSVVTLWGSSTSGKAWGCFGAWRLVVLGFESGYTHPKNPNLWSFSGIRSESKPLNAPNQQAKPLAEFYDVPVLAFPLAPGDENSSWTRCGNQILHEVRSPYKLYGYGLWIREKPPPK